MQFRNIRKSLLWIILMIFQNSLHGQQLQFGSSHTINLSDRPINYQTLGFPNGSPLANKKGIEIETNGNRRQNHRPKISR